MANLPNITDQNSEAIMKESGVTVVDFSATWCAPCKKLAPIFEELASDYNDKAKFYTCDIEEAQNFAMQHSVMSVPTIAIFKDGERQDTIIGFQPKPKLEAKIAEYL